METRKLSGLTEDEWREINRAYHTGFFKYVFCYSAIYFGLIGMFFGIFFSELRRSSWDAGPAFDAMLHGGGSLGMLFFVLFLVTLRSIDWIGKRKTAKAAGL